MGTSPYNCCSDDCITGCDNFDRADSTDLGSEWCEQSGDWEIQSGNLVGKSPGIAVYTRKVDPDVGYFMATITDVRVGCIYQLHAFQGTFEDPCEYLSSWTLELEVTGGSAGRYTGTLRLKSPSGDVACEQAASIGESTGLSLHVGPERIKGAAESSYSILACRGSLDGVFFAVGNGSSSQPATFSSVYYSQHYSENTDCPQSDCGCDGHCLPDTLTATAVSYQYCTNMDGMSWELERGPNCASCVWTMNIAYWNADRCCMKLSLAGPSLEYGSAGFGLSIWDPMVGWLPLTLQESQCNPLYLKFCFTKNPCEGFSGGWSCCEGAPPPPWPYGAQGSFCIEITE